MNCEITNEDLAAFAIGESEPGREAEIREHIINCTSCHQRIKALEQTDTLLESLKPTAPSVSAILSARRSLSEIIHGSQVSEIMTLEETANFLRITSEQLGEIVEDLPAFELAGQIRVRRARLVEWIQRRERDYNRQVSESWVARANVHGLGTGVA